MRTAPERLRGAHRGVDPEPPRLVVRGRDDAAAVRVAADDERLRPQRRVLELLDGREEGIEVEVRDDHAWIVRSAHHGAALWKTPGTALRRSDTLP